MHRLSSIFAVFIMVCVWLCPLLHSSVARAVDFPVNSTANAGAGSLRSAILAAENTAAPDRIVFAFNGPGPHTIVLSGPLPIITRPLVIDGYSQRGAAPATESTPARLMIEIDASAVGRAIDIGGDDIEIRGLVVHSAQNENIFVEGRRNIVAGNHIGTNVAGDAVLGQALDNVVLHVGDNRVGGSNAADRNVIAGGNVQISVEGGANEVRNNRIGTSADGTRGLGLGGFGVNLESDGNLVRGNLIASQSNGMFVSSNRNRIEANRIGTDAAGITAIPNGLGIEIEGGDDNVVGGNQRGDGNLISACDFEAILIEAHFDGVLDHASGNRVLGNLIGTDVTGTLALGNGHGTEFLVSGVVVESPGNTIGESSSGNVVVASAGHGIEINGSAATDTIVLANLIGTNATGAQGFGNGGSGIQSEASRTKIGDGTEAGQNTIAHNGEDGVTIASGTNVSVTRNAIFSNGNFIDDLAIDLAGDGITENDAADVDSGANELLNYPIVVAARTNEVDWDLSGLANTDFLLEFYGNSACDSSGRGEGERFLGAVQVTTGNSGRALGTAPVSTISKGETITATATRLSQVGALPQSTSEFSACRLAE